MKSVRIFNRLTKTTRLNQLEPTCDRLSRIQLTGDGVQRIVGHLNGSERTDFRLLKGDRPLPFVKSYVFVESSEINVVQTITGRLVSFSTPNEASVTPIRNGFLSPISLRTSRSR